MEAAERGDRRSGRANTDIREDLRSEFERDLDRFYYTYYFRRLAEITQVASYTAPRATSSASGASALPHNRLTHSLKVGQVGRRMAQYLINDSDNATGIEQAGGLDPNVVEAAGRAHDLGHPPFGHIGEEVLDAVAAELGLNDGFEGNAQTFRILASLVQRYSRQDKQPSDDGLNLTSATLAASVKYPWPRGESGKRWRKFGYISLDEAKFQDMVAPRLLSRDKGTLEAQIMDWADDITYATHDIEDFALDGSIPIAALHHRQEGDGDDAFFRPVNPEEFEAFWSYAETKLRAMDKVTSAEAKREFQRLATLFPRRQPDGSRRAEAHLSRLSSHIITLTSQATSVNAVGELERHEEIVGLVNALKQLTWYYVIDRPDVASAQRGQRKRLRALTLELVDWCTEAFRTEDIPPWGGHPTKLSASEIRANANALPDFLRDLVSTLLEANNRHGAYRDDRARNIARGVIDFVASMRETEVDELFSRMCSGDTHRA
ncbi:dGTPase [Geodermatophilus africanus]|uniref:dGTPase n=1 Tax=Geodermatophilus africanus TaxID=1137993 RepID=A0A1H3LXK6_9ACTN|nr:dNTP triphosphohydrolase [Geodermatophilus africanus]SDY69257.1 dGTPase [Geodermatophilus africanus]